MYILIISWLWVQKVMYRPRNQSDTIAKTKEALQGLFLMRFLPQYLLTVT